MQWTDDALVLRVGRFREADLWVRMLTRHHGVLTAFAFGGSRSRRRFVGCLDSFNRIRASVESSRDGRFLNMREATLLSIPGRIRQDWHCQGMAANCALFVEALGVPPDSGEASYMMLEECFRLIESGGASSSFLPVLFRLRAAAEQGYAPELDSCARCGRDLSMAAQAQFLASAGSVCCPGCSSPLDPDLPLCREALDILRRVKEKSPSEWRAAAGTDAGGKTAASSYAMRQAARAVDAFIRYHIGLEWSGGRFKAV